MDFQHVFLLIQTVDWFKIFLTWVKNNLDQSKTIWTSPKQFGPVQNLFEPIKGTSHNILKMTYDMNIRYKISKQGWGDGQGPNHIFRVFPIINIDKLMKTVLFGLGLIPCRHQGFETQGCNHLNWSHTSKEPHTDLQLKIEKSTYRGSSISTVSISTDF